MLRVGVTAGAIAILVALPVEFISGREGQFAAPVIFAVAFGVVGTTFAGTYAAHAWAALYLREDSCRTTAAVAESLACLAVSFGSGMAAACAGAAVLGYFE